MPGSHVSTDGVVSRLVLAAARALGAVPRPVAAAGALVWMGALYWLSSDRRDLLPSGLLSEIVTNAGHAPIYGVLALLVARAASGAGDRLEPGRRARAVALATVLLYGLTDEWHQSFVSGRSASPFDLVTNLVGATGALWLLALAGGAPDEGRARWRLAACIAAALAAGALATAASATPR